MELGTPFLFRLHWVVQRRLMQGCSLGVGSIPLFEYFRAVSENSAAQCNAFNFVMKGYPFLTVKKQRQRGLGMQIDGILQQLNVI